MDADARILMDELRRDHRNMAIVLDLLDQIVADMEGGKDPDCELFEEIMRYMTVYPDAVHHPKEDVMYEKLRTKRPDLADDLDHVPDDHRELARLGSLLRSEVEAINAGSAVVRRDRLIDDTAAYSRFLRKHMAWEEEDLFSRIDLMLNAEPYTVDISSIENARDPVFELEVEAGFRRLLASLAA